MEKQPFVQVQVSTSVAVELFWLFQGGPNCNEQEFRSGKNVMQGIHCYIILLKVMYWVLYDSFKLEEESIYRWICCFKWSFPSRFHFSVSKNICVPTKQTTVNCIFSTKNNTCLSGSGRRSLFGNKLFGKCSSPFGAPDPNVLKVVRTPQAKIAYHCRTMPTMGVFLCWSWAAKKKHNKKLPRSSGTWNILKN